MTEAEKFRVETLLANIRDFADAAQYDLDNGLKTSYPVMGLKSCADALERMYLEEVGK